LNFELQTLHPIPLKQQGEDDEDEEEEEDASEAKRAATDAAMMEVP